MYSKVKVDTHVRIPMSEVRDIEAARSFLTIEKKHDGEEPEIIKLYDESQAGWFGIPLYHFKKWSNIANEVDDRRTLGWELRSKFTSGYWEGQGELVLHFRSRVRKGDTGFLVQAPTGFGKTVVLLSMMTILNRTTLVVVPRSNLIPQWTDEIVKHTNIKRSKIGWAEGGKADWVGKAVVVALVHTLALDRFGDEFKHYFGTVLFDEVDRSVPPVTFSPVVGMFPAKYRVGVSATMARTDGTELIFKYHIGQKLLVGSDSNRMKPKVLMVSWPHSSGYVPAHIPKMNRRGMMLSRLGNDISRNRMLCRFIAKIMVSDRRVLILSERIAQLEFMMSHMGVKFNVKRKDMGLYISKTKKPDKERIASDCKLIFATYGMFAIGTDIPALAGLVYATPVANQIQSKGRIERQLEGKKTPVIVDVVDEAYRDARGWGMARLLRYQDDGISVKHINYE